MKLHRFASHSPEDRRRLSNLGHLVEGLLLAAVAILAFLGGAGIAAWGSAVWPMLILVAGLLLLLFIYLPHPPSDWRAIWRDAQQRQHTLMAAAIAAAGAAELLRGSGPLWAYVWPAALLLIGVMFLVHEQHGTSAAAAKAVRLHRILGATIIIAGLLRAGDIVSGAGVLALLWPLALLAGALQLLIYREPPGAYESTHAGHS